MGFLDRARSGYEQGASFKSANMENKHGGSIRSHDCYQKRCAKNSLTQCSLCVMESRATINYTSNIHRPSTSHKEVD